MSFQFSTEDVINVRGIPLLTHGLAISSVSVVRAAVKVSDRV